MEYKCPYCQSVFSYRSGKYRHMEKYCSKKTSATTQTSPITLTESRFKRKITIKLKNTNFIPILAAALFE